MMRPPGWFPPLRSVSALRGPEAAKAGGGTAWIVWRTRGIPGLPLGDPEATSLPGSLGAGLLPSPSSPFLPGALLPSPPTPQNSTPGARAPTPVSPALPVLQHFHGRQAGPQRQPRRRRPLAFLPQTCSSSVPTSGKNTTKPVKKSHWLSPVTGASSKHPPQFPGQAPPTPAPTSNLRGSGASLTSLLSPTVYSPR